MKTFITILPFALTSSARATHHLAHPDSLYLSPQLPMADPSSDNPIYLSDILPNSPSINIFSSLTREISSVTSRLESTTQNATVLAPSNAAMKALPRKPWEDPEEYEKFGAEAYKGQSGSDRANENLQRFAEAHVVLESPWKEGKRAKTMGGGEVWWEKKDGEKVIQPGGVKVSSVADKVSNGEVWVLEGVINYSK